MRRKEGKAVHGLGIQGVGMIEAFHGRGLRRLIRSVYGFCAGYGANAAHQGGPFAHDDGEVGARVGVRAEPQDGSAPLLGFHEEAVHQEELGGEHGAGGREDGDCGRLK